MKFKVKTSGFKELDDALGQLPKATGKNVLRRAALAALEPMQEAAAAKAPEDTGWLSGDIDTSTRLTRRQRRTAKKASTVEVYMGPGSSPRSIVQEFGSADQPAQPYMRPAWDGGKEQLLDDVKETLGAEIDKAAARVARKAARLRKA